MYLMRSVLGHASEGEWSKKYHFKDMLLDADTNAAHEASDEIDFSPNISDVFKQICTKSIEYENLYTNVVKVKYFCYHSKSNQL